MFVLMLTEEPPPMEVEPFYLSPLFYVFVFLLVLGIVAWKCDAILEFIVMVCTTIAGFIIGFMAIPDNPSMGLAVFSAVAALLLSIAAIALIKILKKPETTTN